MQCSAIRWYHDTEYFRNDIDEKNLFWNKSRQRLSLPGLDAVRPNDPPGAVRVPNQCLHAQHSLNHLQYIDQPYANPNLAATAKTVRPREKSFISAISRFQIPEQPLDMNDVRGQEMSEKTLLSLWKSVFRLWFLSVKRCSRKMYKPNVCHTEAVIPWKGLFQPTSPSPSFLGKTHFAKKKFWHSISRPIDYPKKSVSYG